MKFLFDLFPVILFFAAYKLAGSSPESAHEFMTQILGSGVSLDQAPILLATAVTILASLIQVSILLVLRKKVDGMLWLSLGIITLFGGATLFFHNPTFIKWKPTVLYWLFSLVLLVSATLGRNLIRQMLEDKMVLPDSIWHQLNRVWALFFAVMGAVNLFVAYQFSEPIWVNFKLFGLTACMLVFVLAQGAWLSRHLPEEE